jgi:ethanolamine utilization protein EutA (predicted chaperonin)
MGIFETVRVVTKTNHSNMADISNKGVIHFLYRQVIWQSQVYYFLGNIIVEKFQRYDDERVPNKKKRLLH